MDRRHRDVGGLQIGLLGGSIHHIGSRGEVAGLDLELLPGLHQLDHRAGDLAPDDAEGEQGTDGEFVAADQPDAQHHRGDARQLAQEFGEGTDRLAGDLQFEVFTDVPAVAVLKCPAGFEFSVLGFDRLNAGQGFRQIAAGVHSFLHRSPDLIVNDRVHNQRQHDEQRQRAEGHQGEQRIEAQQTAR